MMQYRTKDGDMIDQIALSASGGSVSLEAIYAANPGVAALGPVLPSGILISLPITASAAPSVAAPVRKVVRLWGDQ
jgi:phage tail protein X